MNLISIANLDVGQCFAFWRKTPTVLVVEDNKIVAACIRESAETEGFAVIVSESGEQALGVLHSNGKNYVCVVIDVRLPGMTGWELFARIKEKWPNVKIRMISIDFDNFRAIPRGIPVTVMLKNGHHYIELFRQLKSELK